MTFNEALPLIRTICWRWCKIYHLLDFDEFINEIWLRCDFSKFTALTGQGVGRYIEFRIIDYIRDTFGRDNRKKYDNRGVKRLETVAYGIICTHKGFDEVDGTDEFEKLISRLKPKDRRIIDMYYRQGFTQDKIGKIVRLSRAGVSRRQSLALDRLRKKAG